WIHPKLAIQLAQWLDPAFALWVSDLVMNWFTTNNHPPTLQLPQTYEESLEQLLASVKTQKALAAKIEEDAPKVEAYENLIDAEAYYKGVVYAKMLGWGHIRLYRVLRHLKIFMQNNVPYQQFIDAGFFVVKQSTFTVNNEKQVQLSTLATPKGVEYLRRRLAREGLTPDDA
ncbi:MAG: phage antirepressor KilAC domain-containing protein, partial [Deinococcota bacterium]